MPMKIAILTSGILPVPAVQGGAVENLIDFYLAYNDQHQLHDITVYSVADPMTRQHPALQSSVNHYCYIDTRSLWARISKHVRHLLRGEGYYHHTIEYYLSEALRQLSRQHYDLILLENRPAYALELPQLSGTKVVCHLHNDFLNADTPSGQSIYQRTDGIITVSDYIRSRVRTLCPADTKTHTVHNGIDLQAFSKDKFASSRASMGLQPDDFVMIFSGRVTKEKGIMELIEALAVLHDYPRIKLLVLGSSFYGNSKDDCFMAELKTKASSLSDRILFTGFIPYNQIPDYLSMADVAVIPSVWDDPFPTTVLEAQAMGLPIISTHRGGISEEVTAGQAILLPTDGQFVEHLAEAILCLYQHPEQRTTMSEVALQHAKLFSKEHYAKHFFEVLSDF